MIPTSASLAEINSTGSSETLIARDADGRLFEVEPLTPAAAFADEPPLRIESLHAMKYCERLFYFQEVEQISVAHADVYAGRRLHDDIVADDDVTPEKRSFQVGSETWGLIGKADACRKRDGQWIAYEHKRGRCRRELDNSPGAWPSDRIQAIAYAVLIAETLGEPVPEARIRYHKDNVTAKIVVDDSAREDLREAIKRARELRRSDLRPPVTDNEKLCSACSLAPVCLPEEERSRPEQIQLFPSRRSGQTLHVLSPKARVGRSANTILVTVEDEVQKLPIEDVDSVVIHGSGQITTQALHLCSSHGIPVQWYSMGGKFMAGTQSVSGRVRQRIRQFKALSDPNFCVRLARVTIQAKVESQLRYLMRATRSNDEKRSETRLQLDRIRQMLDRLADATNLDTIRGLEGQAAKAYFAAMPELISSQATEHLIPRGRTKHPPKDRFNCLLSYGYSLLFGLVQRSLIAVGLEPAFGYFHQPRSTAPPLVLDVMELFRTAIWDMPLVGSVNRAMWNDCSLFCIAPGQIWLSESGKKQAIRLFESRLSETFKHPHTGTSIEYARIVELECRLLEKEWSSYPGEFGQMRLR